MQNIIFIGTLHDNHTPYHELIKLLEKFSPDILLVEITQKDIDKNETSDYPPEMITALNWARKNKVKVYGFDSETNPTRKDVPKSVVANLEKEQAKIINRHNWKGFNRTDMQDVLQTQSWQKVVDPRLRLKREKEMSQNIKRYIRSDKTCVVVTGSGHLPFFRNSFSGAQFPLS